MTWRPALRVARRTVRRSLGRSLLVATLVGLPVAGATMLSVLYRTAIENPALEASREMLQADARVDVTAARSMPDDFIPRLDVGWVHDVRDRDRDPASVDLAALLPAGTEVVAPPLSGNDVRVLRDDGTDGTVRARLTVADLTEPLLAGSVRRVEGSLPDRADEVLVSDRLAERLGVAAGDRLTLVGGGSYDVVGTGVAPDCLDCETLFVTRSAPVALAAIADDALWSFQGDANSRLVDLPAGTDVDALWPELAEQGVALLPRELYTDPDRYGRLDGGPTSVESLQATALVAMVVGLGLLEVVLLAGTAFAVGARRQVRDLGLVAVAGGTARDVRRVVLAQGLVLGAIGAVGGLVVGALVAVGGRPLWERLGGVIVEDYRAGWIELVLATAVGLLSGLAAAVVPAVGAARMQPVDALMRRFRRSRATRVGVPVLGLALLVAGAVLALVGSRALAKGFAAYEARLATVQQTGDWVSVPTPTGPVALVLGGLTVAVVGLVLTVPTLVSLVGRLGGRLSLSPRLALREAARHRHRTGPAATAIAVAVAGTVAGAVLMTNLERGEELRTIPFLPPGVITVETASGPYAGADAVAATPVADAARAAADVLPDARAVRADLVVAPAVPGAAEDDLWNRSVRVQLPCVPLPDDPSVCTTTGDGTLRAGDGDLLALVLGRPPTAEERRVLDGGGVVTTLGASVEAGRVTVLVPDSAPEDAPRAATRTECLPAVMAVREQAYGAMPESVISPATAERLGFEVVPTQVLVVPADPDAVTADQVDRARDAAEALGATTFLDEPSNPFRLVRAILLSVGAFVTVVGVAIAVALSAAEGRADLATLAAVGAPPARRRRLTAAQALLVGLLGCLTGVGLGVFAGYVARATTGSPDFLVPWPSVAVVAVGVPVLAALVAGLVTPSRLPLLRRVD